MYQVKYFANDTLFSSIKFVTKDTKIQRSIHIQTFAGGRKSEKQMLQLKKTKKVKAQELKVLVNAITKVKDTDEDKIKQVENRYARKFCRNY